MAHAAQGLPPRETVWQQFRRWRDEDGLTLVTYDLKTIPPVLAAWGSTQSEQMKYSLGGDQVRQELQMSYTGGYVDTPVAFLNTLKEPWKGTQAEVGGYIWWDWHQPDGSYKVHVYNRMSFYSFLYHGLNLIHLPEYGRFDFGFGPMGNINQHFYYTEEPDSLKSECDLNR